VDGGMKQGKGKKEKGKSADKSFYLKVVSA
jgi:hypothetical protein